MQGLQNNNRIDQMLIVLFFSGPTLDLLSGKNVIHGSTASVCIGKVCIFLSAAIMGKLKVLTKDALVSV